MIPNPMSKKVLALSSVAVLCGTIALANPPNAWGTNSASSITAQAGSLNSSTSGTSGGSSQPSRADKIFVQKASMDGVAEVQLGQLAAQKGGSDEVKQFGQKMVDDHTKLNEQMKPIAEQMGMNTPPAPSSKDQALMKKLQGQSGQQFDQTYIKAMVKDHHKDVTEFTREENTTKDPALKTVVSAGLPVIQQHLQMAQQLAQAQKGKSSTTKSTGGGQGQ